MAKKRTKNKTNNYLDKNWFAERMGAYYNECQASDEPVTIPDDLANAFYLIAKNMSTSRNYRIPSYMMDSVVSDAVLKCITYAKNYNPNITNNAFAYFSQIVHYSIIYTMEREQSHFKTKCRYLQRNAFLDGEIFDSDDVAENGVDEINEHIDMLRTMMEFNTEPKEKPEKKNTRKPLYMMKKDGGDSVKVEIEVEPKKQRKKKIEPISLDKFLD